MAKAKMPHSGHDTHLCYLQNLGFARERPGEYKDLVRGAKFMCVMCGRAAAKEKNLCKAVKL